MCLTTPARVVAVDADVAVVDMDGRRRRASLLLEPDVRVGDWVLVGVGRVLRRLDPREAAELTALLRPAAATATNQGGAS